MRRKKGNWSNLPALLLVSLIFILVGGRSWASDSGGQEGSDETMGHGAAGQVAVARVNGVEINMAMLMKKMRDLARRKYGSQEITSLVATKIKNDALEELITEELAYQKAHAVIGEVPKTELDAAMAAEVQRLGGEEKFQEGLAKVKMSPEALRKEMARTLAVQLYIEREIEDKIQVSDEEISLAYEGAKDKYFVQREVVQVTDVTFFVDPASPDAPKRLQAFREKVLALDDKDPAKLQADGTFIAQKNVPLDKVKDKELYLAAKALKEHELSAPIQVAGTMHVVQLTGYKPDVAKKLNEVRGYLVNELKNIKKQALVNQWIDSFRVGAKIEVVDITQQE